MEHELCRIHYLQCAVWYALTQSHTKQCEKMSLASNVPRFINNLLLPAASLVVSGDFKDTNIIIVTANVFLFSSSIYVFWERILAYLPDCLLRSPR